MSAKSSGNKEKDFVFDLTLSAPKGPGQKIFDPDLLRSAKLVDYFKEDGDYKESSPNDEENLSSSRNWVKRGKKKEQKKGLLAKDIDQEEDKENRPPNIPNGASQNIQISFSPSKKQEQKQDLGSTLKNAIIKGMQSRNSGNGTNAKGASNTNGENSSLNNLSLVTQSMSNGKQIAEANKALLPGFNAIPTLAAEIPGLTTLTNSAEAPKLTSSRLGRDISKGSKTSTDEKNCLIQNAPCSHKSSVSQLQTSFMERLARASSQNSFSSFYKRREGQEGLEVPTNRLLEKGVLRMDSERDSRRGRGILDLNDRLYDYSYSLTPGTAHEGTRQVESTIRSLRKKSEEENAEVFSSMNQKDNTNHKFGPFDGLEGTFSKIEVTSGSNCYKLTKKEGLEESSGGDPKSNQLPKNGLINFNDPAFNTFQTQNSNSSWKKSTFKSPNEIFCQVMQTEGTKKNRNNKDLDGSSSHSSRLARYLSQKRLGSSKHSGSRNSKLSSAKYDQSSCFIKEFEKSQSRRKSEFSYTSNKSHSHKTNKSHKSPHSREISQISQSKIDLSMLPMSNFKRASSSNNRQRKYIDIELSNSSKNCRNKYTFDQHTSSATKAAITSTSTINPPQTSNTAHTAQTSQKQNPSKTSLNQASSQSNNRVRFANPLRHRPKSLSTTSHSQGSFYNHYKQPSSFSGLYPLPSQQADFSSLSLRLGNEPNNQNNQTLRDKGLSLLRQLREGKKEFSLQVREIEDGGSQAEGSQQVEKEGAEGRYRQPKAPSISHILDTSQHTEGRERRASSIHSIKDSLGSIKKSFIKIRKDLETVGLSEGVEGDEGRLNKRIPLLALPVNLQNGQENPQNLLPQSQKHSMVGSHRRTTTDTLHNFLQRVSAFQPNYLDSK